MIIRKVRMENFRGFREKTIDFGSKPVVLLSAANGIGKTTTIDAIEWCLTGNIGRLKTAFDNRSTNDVDRKKNTDGILKHRDAGKRSEVRVELSLLDGGKERTLCRTQKKDELAPDLSTFTLDGSQEDAEVFFREYIGDSFYNFHFCDIQKSFNIQSQKRTNLNALFSEFITNYDDQKQFAENLEIFAEDVDRHIEEWENQKVSQELIQSLQVQLAAAGEAAEQAAYPGTIFYPGEETDILSLNSQALAAQRKAVRNCGYLAAEAELRRLVEEQARRRCREDLKTIVSCWAERGEQIRGALESGFPESDAAITDREGKIRFLGGLRFAKNNIFRDGYTAAELGKDGLTVDDLRAAQTRIEQKEQRVKTLSDEIQLLTGNNQMLKLLSALSANKQAVIAYRDAAVAETGAVRCPVCGAESFATMDAAAVLAEADAYILRNGEAVKAKTAEQETLKKEIDKLYRELIRRAEAAVQEEIQAQTAMIDRLNDLRRAAQPYFDAVGRVRTAMPQVGARMLDGEEASALLAEAEAGRMEEAEEARVRAAYRRILTVLGYNFERETVQQSHEKVKNLISGVHPVTDFSYEVFVSKLNSIDSILDSHRVLALKQKLEEHDRHNRAIDAETARLTALKDKATGRAADIRALVEALSKDEFKKVGPALTKFYNKLARFNAAEGIEIRQEEKGISIVDHKGKNIVNVLSNGQISVFMLAYFFAAINTRNDRERMKVYFIDDLTACMDDVNMLAFMDLLKYQMSSKATMEQLFFVTCDDRISGLLNYKMKGRGIALCELKEADFV